MRYPPLLLSAALLAPASYADIQFNGFLSAIGGVATDEPVRGYEKDMTFKQDTLFGLQASADISDKLSMTGQLVSRGDKEYATELAWGYIAYEASSNFTFRLGRFRTPFYFYSDFLEVGYAYPWIAPSDEVYAVQFDNIDGIDVFYNTTVFDNLNIDLQAYYGSISSDFVLDASGDSIDTETRNHLGLVATFGLGDFSLRLSGHNATLSVNDIESSIPAIAQLYAALDGAAVEAPPIKPITDDIKNTIGAIEEVNATFAAAGLKYDGEYVFGLVEATNLQYDDGPSAEQRRYVVSGGVNIGSATLFASYAAADDEYVDLSKDLKAIGNPALAPLIAGVDQASELLGTTSNTVTVGIRYDFEPGAAFKIQYDSVTTTPSPLNSNDDITNGLVRFGVDLVF